MNDDERKENPAALARTQGSDLAAPARTIKLGSGRTLAIDEQGGEERLEVRSPDGKLVVSLRLTDEGPVLSLSSVSLEIAARKHLSLSSETLAIKTTGDATLDIGGELRERARDVSVSASPGAVSIVANDDVSLTGERVRLNSDDPAMPLSWEEYQARNAPAPALPAGGGSSGKPDS